MSAVSLVACSAILALAPSPRAGQSVHFDRDVEARMRDGVVLRADVLRPDRPGRFPALLVRTPYGKKTEWSDDDFAVRAARAGYVVVVQDVRGPLPLRGRLRSVSAGGPRRLRHDRVGRGPALLRRAGGHDGTLVPRRGAVAGRGRSRRRSSRRWRRR